MPRLRGQYVTPLPAAGGRNLCAAAATSEVGSRKSRTAVRWLWLVQKLSGLAFSGEHISSRRLHKTPRQLRWHFGANMGKGGGTFERLLGKLSTHFLSSPLSRQTASSKCDVFPSVLFWQTLGLWLPGQLTGFSRLANNYVIIVRRPRNCH